MGGVGGDRERLPAQAEKPAISALLTPSLPPHCPYAPTHQTLKSLTSVQSIQLVGVRFSSSFHYTSGLFISLPLLHFVSILTPSLSIILG